MGAGHPLLRDIPHLGIVFFETKKVKKLGCVRFRAL